MVSSKAVPALCVEGLDRAKALAPAGLTVRADCPVTVTAPASVAVSTVLPASKLVNMARPVSAATPLTKVTEPDG